MKRGGKVTGINYVKHEHIINLEFCIHNKRITVVTVTDKNIALKKNLKEKDCKINELEESLKMSERVQH